MQEKNGRLLLCRGVSQDLSAPILPHQVMEMLQYAKRLKGIRIEERTGTKGYPMYSFFSKKGLFKIRQTEHRMVGKLLMSAESEFEIGQDPLMTLFYAAVFCLRMNGTFTLSYGKHSQYYRLKEGEIFKEGSLRPIRVKNATWEQYVALQLVKGRINLLLDKLSHAMNRKDHAQIEVYKAELAKLQEQAWKLRSLDD